MEKAWLTSFGTEDINESKKLLAEKGFTTTEPSEGAGKSSMNNEIKNGKIFFTSRVTRGIFSFIIQHTHGSLLNLKNIKNHQ